MLWIFIECNSYWKRVEAFRLCSVASQRKLKATVEGKPLKGELNPKKVFPWHGAKFPAAVPAGEITLGELKELMPPGFSICLLCSLHGNLIDQFIRC